VCSSGTGRLDLFVVDESESIFHRSFLLTTNGWSGWEMLPGAVSTAPAAVSPLRNRIDLFCGIPGLFSSGGLVHSWLDQNTGQWSGWENLKGSPSGVAAASSFPNRVDVFILGGGGGGLPILGGGSALLSQSSNTGPNGAWTPWTTGEGLLPDPAAAWALLRQRKLEIKQLAQSRDGYPLSAVPAGVHSTDWWNHWEQHSFVPLVAHPWMAFGSQIAAAPLPSPTDGT
jgi:hypothetical protein